MGSTSVLFRRPVKVGGSFPTRRHVMFGNCGTARGHTEEDLASFLEEILEVSSTASSSSSAGDSSAKRYEIYLGQGAVSNVSFPSVEVAQRVIAKVDGMELKGCKLNVCFADRSDSPTNSKQQLSRFGLKKPGVPDPGSYAMYSTMLTEAIPGLELYQNYVTDAQADRILEDINRGEWDCKIKRRVQHYGYAFNYIFLGVDPNKPLGMLPDFCYYEIGEDNLPMMDSIDKAIGWKGDKHYFDQLTVNEYVPQIGIGFHVDTHSMFDDYMAVISLGDPIVLEFRRNGVTIPLFIPSNSLLIIGGEARYAWKHGIASRSNDPLPDREKLEMAPRGKRVSLTFRRITHPKFCKCPYPEVCDSQTPSSLQLPGRLPRDEDE